MDEQALNALVNTIVEKVGHQADDMSLDRALTLVEQVKEKAKQMGIKAVIAVSNKAARPVLVECMDDSYMASYDIAVQKAFTVVALKMSTAQLKPLAQPGGPLYGIQFTNEGHVVIFGGGEPLKNAAGQIIGGLGVSGGSEEQDMALATYGKEIFERMEAHF